MPNTRLTADTIDELTVGNKQTMPEWALDVIDKHVIDQWNPRKGVANIDGTMLVNDIRKAKPEGFTGTYFIEADFLAVYRENGFDVVVATHRNEQYYKITKA